MGGPIEPLSRDAAEASASAGIEPAVRAIPLRAEALAVAAPSAPPAPKRSRREGAASPNVLRPCFQPLRLPRRLGAILAEHRAASPSYWIMAAAAGRVARASRPDVPRRALQGLATVFLPRIAHDQSGRERAAACRKALELALPEAAWTAPDFLGEVLLAARNAQRHGKNAARDGRAGRASEADVYTPASIARSMIEAVHIGAKRVLDPACGAGVFLLAAFERAFRRRVEGGQEPKEAARAALRNEIAGLDVDPEAVALAKFGLRLAAWEAAGLDEEDLPAVHRADALVTSRGWEGRADIVIGNPPFVEGRGLTPRQIDALRGRFRCAAVGKVNLFAVFVERGLEFLREGGVLSFILPATFQRNDRYRALREHLLNFTLESIEPLDGAAFGGHVVETVVLRVRKQPPARSWRVSLPGGKLAQRNLPVGPGLRFCDRLSDALRRQIAMMERHGVPLGNHFEVRDGISTGFQPFPKRLLGKRSEDGRRFVAEDGTRVPFDAQRHVKVIDGAEFTAYGPVSWAGRFIEYDKRHEHEPPHPGRPFNCQLRERSIFDRDEKILSRQTGKGLTATVDRQRYFARNSVHVLYVKPGAALSEAGANESMSFSLAALCACLNSRFYKGYFLAVTGENGAVFPQVHIADLKRIPVLPGLLRAGSPVCRLGESLLALHGGGGLGQSERIAKLQKDVERLLEEAFGLRD